MMNRRITALVLGAVAVSHAAMAALSVKETGEGTFDIVRDGITVISNLRATYGSPQPVNIQSKKSVAADGSRVWNRWSEVKEGRFRFELVERKDGAIEVSILGSGDALAKNRWRNIDFSLPSEVYSGKPWKAVVGSGRGYKEGSGAFDGKKGKESMRFLATDGLIFDFQPLGPTGFEMHGHRTIAPIAYFTFDAKGGAIVRYTSNFNGHSGGTSGAKLVLREGDFSDYNRLHPLKKFWYGQRLLASHLLKFGAPRAGNSAARYVDGNVPFKGKYGWMGDVPRKTHVGNKTGAFYSQVTGEGKATYRIAGFEKGWYVVTFQLGNWCGVENRFSVGVNGASMGDDVSVPPKKARIISRCVHVTDGNIDVGFDGKWTVSGIGVQPRLYDAEDFTVSRAFWYVEGYEPSENCRSASYSKPPVIATLDETFDMPEPGKEKSAKLREPPLVKDRGEGDLSWVRELRMWKLPECLGGEFDDVEYREKLFAEQVPANRYNTVVINGMLSRHTFPEDTIALGQKRVAEITRLAKRHGLKVIDHLDVTLLWRAEIGFRVMLERFPQVLRERWTNLPAAFQLCPNNPEMKKWLFEYLKREVEAGVDGFQLDEVEFCSGCMCAHCRERFHRETGWHLPLDETSPDLKPGSKTEFGCVWGLWKSKVVTDWHIELRKYLKKLKPDLYLSKYSTTSNFVKSRYGLNCLVDYGRTMSSFGTEIMTANSIYNGRALLPLMKTKNVLTATFGAPVWNWFYDKTPESNYYSWGLCALLGQVTLLDNPHNDGSVPDPLQWVRVSRSMKADGAEELADVALLFSSWTRDRCRESKHEEELMGLAQELDALHVPYEFVLDVGISAERLSKYKVLFLGDAKLMDGSVKAEIDKFRAAGGKVYARPGIGDYPLQPSCAAFYSREVIPWMSDKYVFDPDIKAEAKVRKELSGLIAGAGAGYWSVSGLSEKDHAALWREKSGDVCVHFLNGRGGDAKPGDRLRLEMVPKTPFPDQEEDIVFEVPCEGRAAVALSPDFFGERKLAVERTGEGKLRVTLPKELFKAYTLVRIHE